MDEQGVQEESDTLSSDEINHNYDDDNSSDEYQETRKKVETRKNRHVPAVASSVPTSFSPLIPPSFPTDTSTMSSPGMTAFQPQLITTLPVMKVVSEVETILENLNCRYKIKPKLLLKCKYPVCSCFRKHLTFRRKGSLSVFLLKLSISWLVEKATEVSRSGDLVVTASSTPLCMKS